MATHRTHGHSSREFSASPGRREDGQSTAETPHSKSAISSRFSALLDGALDTPKGTPTAPAGRRSHFPTRSGQAAAASSPLHRPDSSKGMSSVQELAALLDSTEPQNSPYQRRQSSRQTTPPPRSDRPSGSSSPLGDLAAGLDVASSLDPNNRLGANSNVAAPPPAAPQTAPMKLNSTVGRTIVVDQQRGMDVGRAFRALEMQCARNSVKRDFMRQRYHERPGLKRKRLKSERWRKRFKSEFRGTLAMVQRLKNQGW